MMRARAADSDPWAEWSDEDLLLEYRAGGDRSAFTELVHRYERALFNYLRHYLGNAEMAADAFQNTFLQIHLKCEQFEPGRKVRPWLYTIATNQAIDEQRKNRRHRMVDLDRRMSEENGTSDEGESGAIVDLLDGDEPPAYEIAASKEEAEQVRDEIERLPDTLKHVLILVYYQGLKYREAADVLIIPVGTVKSRLHAAIERLRIAFAVPVSRKQREEPAIDLDAA